MKATLLPRLSFKELYRHFNNTSNYSLSLQSGVGEGSIKIFKPENGLSVSIWDCCFHNGMELYNQALPGKQQDSFTLAYFLEPQASCFTISKGRLPKPVAHNAFFLSATSAFNLFVNPLTRYRCVSIHFSRKWLLKVLETNDTLQHLKEFVGKAGKQEIFQRLSTEERAKLEDLCHGAKTQKHFRAFYIKTAVLQLVCDFLYRMKEDPAFLVRRTLQATPDGVEKWLCEHITKEFPGTKALAQQFSVSESTLKRHFSKKFGVTISAYIISKKMQHAKCLLSAGGMTIAEAARMVGYRSVQNFREAFAKYHQCLRMEVNEWKEQENLSCA